jgi:hypothetical protein
MRSAKGLTTCVIVLAAGVAVPLCLRDWSPRRTAGVSRQVIPPGPEVEALLRRMRARDLVADQLLAGELSLPQAATRFRDLNDNLPQFRVAIEFRPGDSEGEKLCRQVIGWAESRLQSRGMSPVEVEAALSPLLRELNRLLAEKDEIDLPPVD